MTDDEKKLEKARKKRAKKREKRKRKSEKKSKIENNGKRKLSPAAVAIAVVMVLIVSVYVRNIVAMLIEKNELEAENEALQAERDALVEQYEYSSSTEYVEEQAREQLKLVYPDEILFLFDYDSSDDDSE